MSLDLNKLADKLDSALNNETTETLTKFLTDKRMKNNKQSSIKKLFNKIFNTNTGYFIRSHVYKYNGTRQIGYILCKGYIMFGIPGYDRIEIYLTREEALYALIQIQGGNK